MVVHSKIVNQRCVKYFPLRHPSDGLLAAQRQSRDLLMCHIPDHDDGELSTSLETCFSICYKGIPGYLSIYPRDRRGTYSVVTNPCGGHTLSTHNTFHGGKKSATEFSHLTHSRYIIERKRVDPVSAGPCKGGLSSLP